jgi:SAM-dependent methyltransferase
MMMMVMMVMMGIKKPSTFAATLLLRLARASTESALTCTQRLTRATQLDCHYRLLIEPMLCSASTSSRTQLHRVVVVKRLPATNRRAMTTQAHYEAHSATSYESAYFYSPGAYTDYLAKLVVNRLGLQTNSRGRILDIGGGTGNFTKMIVADSPHVEAIVVDPFLEGTEISTDDSPSVKFVHAPAEELAATVKTDAMLWWRQDYQQVLMKEVIHHLTPQDRVAVFTGIYDDVPSGNNDNPTILIITRPQLEIDYPLWKEARQVWAKNQPSQAELESELKQAGFTTVSSTIEPYPCEIEFERWMSMVKGRFWSTFSNFTDEELEEACDLMRVDEAERINDKGIIHFEDRLVFISAYK